MFGLEDFIIIVFVSLEPNPLKESVNQGSPAWQDGFYWTQTDPESAAVSPPSANFL